MSGPVHIGPFRAGLITVLPPEAIPGSEGRNGEPAGLAAAVNVDIDRVGQVRRRGGWVVRQGGSAHSLFEYAGRAWCVLNDTLVEILPRELRPLADVSGTLSWTVLNGEPVCAVWDAVGIIRGEGVEDLPASLATEDEDRILCPLPGGQWIGYWQGRLILARGSSLLLGEPLRYGVFDPIRGRVQFEQRIAWVAPLATGIWVGLRDGVRFLRGADPLAFELVRVPGATWDQAAAVVPTTAMAPDLVEGAPEVALWIGARGFVIGLPSGRAVAVQTERLTGLPCGCGRLSLVGDRVVVVAA